MQRECAKSLVSLDARIPTVILVVRDASKHDVPNAKVLLDGKPWKQRIDGREVPLDPGPHALRFEAAGKQPVEESYTINEREKGRFIEVQLLDAAPSATPPAILPTPSSPPTSETATAPVPPLRWVFGGVAVAGFAVSTFFGVSGLSARADANRCKGSCTQHQVDTVNQRLLAADIALGVGVVAAAAAVWVYLARPTASASAHAAR
jgi:hypothetical protein